MAAMNAKLAAALLLCLSVPCWSAKAQAAAEAAPAVATPDAVAPPPDAAPAARMAASSPQPKERPEPNVQHIVIEDDSAKIDELRVRGTTQHITVTPKVGKVEIKSYEIIPTDGTRDLGPGANTSRGAAGRRVWNVLHF